MLLIFGWPTARRLGRSCEIFQLSLRRRWIGRSGISECHSLTGAMPERDIFISGIYQIWNMNYYELGVWKILEEMGTTPVNFQCNLLLRRTQAEPEVGTEPKRARWRRGDAEASQVEGMTHDQRKLEHVTIIIYIYIYILIYCDIL